MPDSFITGEMVDDGTLFCVHCEIQCGEYSFTQYLFVCAPDADLAMKAARQSLDSCYENYDDRPDMWEYPDDGSVMELSAAVPMKAMSVDVFVAKATIPNLPIHTTEGHEE